MSPRSELSRVLALALVTGAVLLSPRLAAADRADDEWVDKAAPKATCEARKLERGAAPAAGTVRVMSYNIRLGASGTPKDDEQAEAAATTFFAPDPHAKAPVDRICAHLRQLAEVIAAANPDIVAVQEVDQGFGERSAKLDEVRELGVMLGMHYKFSSRKPGYGIALLWRASLDAKVRGTLALADGKEDADHAKQVVAYVDFPKLGLRAAGTHLTGSSKELRSAAAASIKAERELATPTTVLFGDMNTGLRSPDYPDLVAGRHDALPDLKLEQATVANPKEQYDHVFLGAKLTAVDAHVIPTRTLDPKAEPHSHSDHSAIVVDLRVASGS